MLQKSIAPLISAGALLAIWQLVLLLWPSLCTILPSPAEVARAWTAHFSQLAHAAAQTLGIAVLGLVISAILGVVLAALMHTYTPLRAALYPLCIALQNVPTIALAPILILLFGFGALSKLALISLSGFFPIMASLLAALAAAKPDALLLLRSFGATRGQIWRFYLLPECARALAAGCAIAASYALSSATVAEIMGGLEGLGVLLVQAKKLYDYPLMYAAIFTLAALSIALVRGILTLQKWAFHHE